MPALSVCLVTLSLHVSEAGPGRFGGQMSVTDIYHAIPYHIIPPPIILLTDMVTRSRLLAAHGLTSCLSVRTQPLTATGAPSQTSTISYHTMPRCVDRVSREVGHVCLPAV